MTTLLQIRRLWHWLSGRLARDTADAKVLEYQAFMRKEVDSLNSGSEIRPPWVVFPGSLPNHANQGNQQAWAEVVWKPYWKRLTREQRLSYVERWNPQEDLWRGLLLMEGMLNMRNDD